MEKNGISILRRRSPSSDRFLNVFSPPKTASVLSAVEESSGAGDELNEYDVFWTGDFTMPERHSSSPSDQASNRKMQRQSEKFGILAALSEDHRKSTYPMLYRIASLSPPSADSYLKNPNSTSISISPTTPLSRPIPALPKPQSFNNFSQSVPARKFQQSAPVNVPIYANKPFTVDLEIDDDDGDKEMMPPHEIVARSSAARSTFSVLEGVGRTLKGRDLRQVRNGVWRQTGREFMPARALAFV